MHRPIEDFFRIDENRYRAIVYKRDLHHRLKFSGGTFDALLSDFSNNIFIESPSLLRTSSIVKRRTLPAANIAKEGELGDDEHRSTDFAYAEVHLAFWIFKDA